MRTKGFFPYLLLASLTLGACTKSRTEVVIGVATDLSAPDALDLVRLSVQRDGVEILRNDWDITGVPAQPFELPGSFGVITEDGSEPQVQATVTGFLAGKQVLQRDSIFSLLKEQTLFLRMALVQRCEAMGCPSGQTCVEGKCLPMAVNNQSFPALCVPDLYKYVQCDSGTQYKVTSTKMPMPVLGTGTCSTDEYCQEGICYKQVNGVPQGGPTFSDVAGKGVLTFVSESGETQLPLDLSTVPVAALVPGQSPGRFTPIKGSGTADGKISVPSVPAGKYMLQAGTDYLVTESHDIDLGREQLGRPGFNRLTNSQTMLNFNITNLSAFGANDFLAAFAPNVGISSSNFAFVTAGSTVYNEMVLAYFLESGGKAPLIDGSKGDKLSLIQGVTMNSEITYQSVARFYQAPAFTETDGGTTPINGAFSTVSQTQLPIQWKRSQFPPLAALISPKAQYYGQTLTVETAPGTAAHGLFSAQTATLMVSRSGVTDPDVTDTLKYGNPYPASWGVAGHVQADYSRAYVLGMSRSTFLAAAVIYEDTIDNFSKGPVQPLVGPVGQPQIGGKDALSDQTGVTLTPTLTWKAPTLGTTTGYVVRVYALAVVENDGMATQATLVGSFYTKDTTLTLPQGLLQAGAVFTFGIESRDQPGVDITRSPYRIGLPFGSANVLAGMMTP